jgi:hypothetical protein
VLDSLAVCHSCLSAEALSCAFCVYNSHVHGTSGTKRRFSATPGSSQRVRHDGFTTSNCLKCLTSCTGSHVSFEMPLIKTITASVVGALMLSSGTVAVGRSLSQKEGEIVSTNVSSAKCTVISIGYSEGKNQELLVSAGALSSPRFSILSLRRRCIYCVCHPYLKMNFISHFAFRISHSACRMSHVACRMSHFADRSSRFAFRISPLRKIHPCSDFCNWKEHRCRVW